MDDSSPAIVISGYAINPLKEVDMRTDPVTSDGYSSTL